MGKPLVHVKVGIAYEQLVSDAFDAILEQRNYSAAIELNSRLSDVASNEAGLQVLLHFIDIHIE